MAGLDLRGAGLVGKSSVPVYTFACASICTMSRCKLGLQDGIRTFAIVK